MSAQCEIAEAIGDDWLQAPSRIIGPAPATAPTPDFYVLYSKDGVPTERLDVYYPKGAPRFRQVAISWRTWIAIGYADCVQLAPAAGGAALEIPLSVSGSTSYFSDFRVEEGFLLVVSCCGLARVEPDGRLLWRRDDLGLDGVVVSQCCDGMIEGVGEWDPPGGWRAFRLSAESGATLR